ncbi:MAG: DNA topoisomerase VI subunit B [Candidatus Woesearchaeota archaeon]
MVKHRAEELAKEQREISVAAFFEKNRHLLGFDNLLRALSTTVKELVDNSLDATEEMRVLPEIKIELRQLGETRFVVSVQDNGPGIVKEQIPKVFAKLLYGSKFFRYQMSRGQQGIGVSASTLYGQLTTGKPAIITSKIGKKRPAHHYHLKIDINKNEPHIIKDHIVDFSLDHGTRVEIELEGKYQKGKQGVEEYLRQTAIANPHAEVIFIGPDKKKTVFKRVVQKLPKEPKAIKPHPYGVEVGILLRMAHQSKARNLQGFMSSEFSRVSSNLAKQICDRALVDCRMKPKELGHVQAESLIKSIRETKIMAPPLDCLSPIGEKAVIDGLKKEIKADFYAAITRRPKVYRGFPFQIEAGLAYGGEIPSDDSIRLVRLANKVPLQYQQGACSITKSVLQTSWRNYGLSQSKGALPVGPVYLLVHIASVWVPFTSEAKDAIAHYPEIIKELKLALQDVGRKLGSFIRKTVKAKEQQERVNLFGKYIPEVARDLAILSGENKVLIEKKLNSILKKNAKAILNEKKES